LRRPLAAALLSGMACRCTAGVFRIYDCYCCALGRGPPRSRFWCWPRRRGCGAAGTTSPAAAVRQILAMCCALHRMHHCMGAWARVGGVCRKGHRWVSLVLRTERGVNSTPFCHPCCALCTLSADACACVLSTEIAHCAYSLCKCGCGVACLREFVRRRPCATFVCCG
jgi:hypothetical protein